MNLADKEASALVADDVYEFDRDSLRIEEVRPCSFVRHQQDI